MRSPARTIVKVALILFALAGLIALARVFDIQQLLREGLDWISSLGNWGGIFFIFLYPFKPWGQFFRFFSSTISKNCIN